MPHFSFTGAVAVIAHTDEHDKIPAFVNLVSPLGSAFEKVYCEELSAMYFVGLLRIDWALMRLKQMDHPWEAVIAAASRYCH